VLILPESSESSESEQNGMFSHVIFATDWSAASEKGLEYILNFRDIIKELEIVHVIHRKLSVRDMRNLKEKLSKTRQVFLDQGIDAEAHVYAGKPPEEIMLAAKDYDATCIAMGTTGMWTLKDKLLHSCSYRVAEESMLPTLIIP
jgi:nucleotide-binding universal stress UspA family protein